MHGCSTTILGALTGHTIHSFGTTHGTGTALGHTTHGSGMILGTTIASDILDGHLSTIIAGAVGAQATITTTEAIITTLYL